MCNRQPSVLSGSLNPSLFTSSHFLEGIKIGNSSLRDLSLVAVLDFRACVNTWVLFKVFPLMGSIAREIVIFCSRLCQSVDSKGCAASLLVRLGLGRTLYSRGLPHCVDGYNDIASHVAVRC